MPNPGKYKSVGVIDETYEDIQVRVNAKPNYRPPVGIGGLASVIED